MNRSKSKNAQTAPRLAPLLDSLKTQAMRFLNAFRSPYNYLAAVLVLAALVVFFIDVKGSIVSIGIAYMVAVLRLQLTRRQLERQRLEVAEDHLTVALEQLEVSKRHHS